MKDGEDLTGALSAALDAAEGASPADAVEAVTRQLGVSLGAAGTSLLVADLAGHALVRLAHIPQREDSANSGDLHAKPRQSAESTTVLPFDAGPAQQAIQTRTVQVLAPTDPQASEAAGGLWTVLAPVTERGETIGLLELQLPHEPGPDTLADVARAAHLLAFVVITTRRHTDLSEWARRSRPFTLAAEIQQRLLPGAYTCETAAFTLSAWLEPADHVGGDTFDYSVARDVLHLSVADAMGHGIASALTASICAASLRATRRQGASLLQQATDTNAAMADYAASVGDEGFSTAVLGRLDLPTGTLQLIDAGHVRPHLARAGVVETVELLEGLPLGLFADTPYRSTTLTLQPGDRLVIITDGMLEHDAASLDLAATINQTRPLHPTETARYLTNKVLDAAGGALADDATVLVLDWHGHHNHHPNTVTAADPTPATTTL